MKGLQIPERYTGTVCVFAYSDPTSPIYGMLSVAPKSVCEQPDRIIVGSIDIDIPLDHTGSLDKQVEQLKASKRKIIDEASAKAVQIDEAIESLLAIEYNGEQS